MKLSGPYNRSRSMQKRYINYLQGSDKTSCDFCNLEKDSTDQIIEVSRNFLVVKNIFSYDTWDGFGVADHLMIVPRRHIIGLTELTKIERSEFMDIVAKYETQGYSLYARAPDNKTKSIAHQHTHLIKADNKRKRWMFHIRQPHIRLIG